MGAFRPDHEIIPQDELESSLSMTINNSSSTTESESIATLNRTVLCMWRTSRTAGVSQKLKNTLKYFFYRHLPKTLTDHM